ncbi:MAG TPA: DUF389 domain-containing protein [Devosia sp.]|jgi:uncharacterized hydrophobic protein (TIGR00271 family)|nr:DUF389 domain-containing protein [Devosia sp.]
MARALTLAIPADRRVQLLERLQGIDGVVAISVQVGGSSRPDGDIIAVQATNRAAERIFAVMQEMKLSAGSCIAMSELTALVAPDERGPVQNERNESPWEEVETLLRRETNLSLNYLLLMTLSGAIAAVGLQQDQLHIVVGAMLVAPGFEPLVRMVFGPVTGVWSEMRKGLVSTLAGYLMLAIGAAIGFLLAMAMAAPPSEDVLGQHWIGFWSSFSWAGVLVAVLAGLAGSAVVTSRETVFATGVMVALALIPSMAIFGLGLAAGDFDLALRGLGRWMLEAVLVLLAAGAGIALKQALLHRRSTMP